MSEDTSNMFLQGAFSIDAKAATSTSEKHKYLVDGYILGQWGSYRRFNESVSAAFRSAYRSQVEAEEEVSIEVTDREQKEELNQRAERGWCNGERAVARAVMAARPSGGGKGGGGCGGGGGGHSKGGHKGGCRLG
ncbi:unnamed protein product [Prorocentrum cordatum]|uniref:Uncharacterized protein n=1 Tax=Prorocentrum cordatum TaxID=2364126 RepID=A0ABN9SGT6_9DINO|nr:unnamed protein product [Polarella glacialis]